MYQLLAPLMLPSPKLSIKLRKYTLYALALLPPLHPPPPGTGPLWQQRQLIFLLKKKTGSTKTIYLFKYCQLERKVPGKFHCSGAYWYTHLLYI